MTTSVSCTTNASHVYMDNGTATTINWSLEVKGYNKNIMQTVPGVRKVNNDKVMYALENKTQYAICIRSDKEIEFEIYTDGLTQDNCQGRWHMNSGSSGWIMRSANVDRSFVVLKADSEEGKAAGIKDDQYSGMLIVKVYPVETEHDDGVAKCRKKKRNITRSAIDFTRRARNNEFSAAGTAYGAKVDQTFNTVNCKKTVSDCEHITMNILLACQEPEFGCAYGHNTPESYAMRGDFGI